jgi:hypothetical protein
MSDSHLSEEEPGEASREEMLSALFAHMVIQQSNMAMMLLGKVPHPQTGKTVRDIAAAKMFIDQLEMIEAKTKGNLSKEEAQVLKQTLMALHLAFVETVESSPALEGQPAQNQTTADRATETAATPPEARSAPASDSASAPEGEDRRKFSKKY